MVKSKQINITVAYATLECQKVIAIDVVRGSTILEVIQQSGITEIFPEIDVHKQSVGIFGQVRTLNYVVQPGDRVEIYRPLLLDPKDARRARAKKS